MKVLTEKEIQEKLYGHYRPKAAAVAEEELPPPAAEPKNAEADLFVSSREAAVKNEPFFKPRPAARPKRESHFFRNFAGVLKKSFVSAANRVSSLSLPSLPAFRKPRWVEKIESLPLASVAAAFFAAVLLVVGIRAAMHLGFNAWPIERILQAHKAVKPADAVEKEEVSEVEEKIVVHVSEAPTAVPATLVAKKFYTIQLIVYEDSKLAERQVKRLADKKLDAFYKPVRTSRGKERYQVFVGRFASFDEAQNRLAGYKKASLLTEFQDSFVRPQTE